MQQTDKSQAKAMSVKGEHVIKFSKALPKVILKNKILAA
jgi:hypothetical protein